MFLFSVVFYRAFPKRYDALLTSSSNTPRIFVSGSLGFIRDDSQCEPTFPNNTLNDDNHLDWCSNIGESILDKPYIGYYLEHKVMAITGYSVRCGCCDFSRCCDPMSSNNSGSYCCCELETYSLQGSNDKYTWKIIHQVESDDGLLYECQAKTYEFDQTEPFKYVRFVLEKPRKGCINCMQINQFELYGEAITSNDYEHELITKDEDNEESVSIIGKVRRQ